MRVAMHIREEMFDRRARQVPRLDNDPPRRFYLGQSVTYPSQCVSSRTEALARHGCE